MPADKNSNTKAVVAEKLGVVLASTYMLQVKTQNFHWNVVSPQFRDLHLLFEGQYTELQDAVDLLAERIRKLGAVTPASFAEFSKLSKLKDGPSKPPADTAMISTLADDNEALSKLCTEIGDFADDSSDRATGDLMNRRIEAHDKAAWMLRAHLQSAA